MNRYGTVREFGTSHLRQGVGFGVLTGCKGAAKMVCGPPAWAGNRSTEFPGHGKRCDFAGSCRFRFRCNFAVAHDAAMDRDRKAGTHPAPTVDRVRYQGQPTGAPPVRSRPGGGLRNTPCQRNAPQKHRLKNQSQHRAAVPTPQRRRQKPPNRKPAF